MSTTIEPLPLDLKALGRDGVEQAVAQRQQRAKEIAETGPDRIGMQEVAELKRLNDDLERIKIAQETTDPHPGFPPPPEGFGVKREANRIGYGRVEGLGASFVKQVGTKALDGTSGGATMPVAFFDPRLRDLPQRQLFIRSLIPTSQVRSGDKVAYMRQSVFTNNAAAVAAAGVKPTSVITAAREEAPIRVIAHVSEAMDRSMLSDYDQLVTFIDNQLRLGVLLEEERQILLGSGTAPNLTGILNTAGIQTQAKGADPTPDAIQKAITKIRVVFGEPDAAIFHPNDWQDIALLRTTDGQYIWSSPSDEGPLRIWGLKVVVSAVATEGTALVGAFGTAAEVYEREGARITFAETGLGDGGTGELFLKNQLRWRAESRIGLAVFRPNFFCSVTGI